MYRTATALALVALLSALALGGGTGCSSKAQAPGKAPANSSVAPQGGAPAQPAPGGSVLDPAKQAQNAADQMNNAVQQQNQQLSSPGGP